MRSLLLFPLLGLLGCGDATSPPAREPDAETLAPGGVVRGEGGLTVAAPAGALPRPVELILEAAAAAPPLPEGLERRSPSVRVRPAAPGGPVMADGVLLVGLRMPAGDRTVTVAALATPGDTPHLTAPRWLLLPTVRAPDGDGEEVALAAVHALPAEGLVLALVASGRAARPLPVLRAARPTPQVDAAVVVTCGALFAHAQVPCGVAEEAQATAVAELAIRDLATAGLRAPRLARRLMAASLAPAHAALGEPAIELVPFIEAGIGGIYSPLAGHIEVVLDGPFGEEEELILRHELFHATQYGYDAVYAGWLAADEEARSRSRFFIEGQATLAEDSRAATLRRALGRLPRTIEESLLEDLDELEYEAQDFWLHLGQTTGGGGLGFLGPFLERGAQPERVDETLRLVVGDEEGLAGRHWAWVKDQGYEHSLPLPPRVQDPCEPASIPATPTLTYDPLVGAAPISFTSQLPPLGATRLRVELRGTADAAARVVVTSPAGALRAKIYRRGEAGCAREPDARERDVELTAGRDLTIDVLVANGSLDAPATFELRVVAPTIEARPPALAASLTEGEVERQTLRLTNRGAETLTYSAIAGPFVYVIGGAGGVLGPGAFADVEVQLLCVGHDATFATEVLLSYWRDGAPVLAPGLTPRVPVTLTCRPRELERWPPWTELDETHTTYASGETASYRRSRRVSPQPLDAPGFEPFVAITSVSESEGSGPTGSGTTRVVQTCVDPAANLGLIVTDRQGINAWGVPYQSHDEQATTCMLVSPFIMGPVGRHATPACLPDLGGGYVLFASDGAVHTRRVSGGQGAVVVERYQCVSCRGAPGCRCEGARVVCP
jgi:hypothetical protein